MLTQHPPFIVPTYGIANTDPLDMEEETFNEWLECIPEEKREEWRNLYDSKKYRFPEPATPAEDAKLIDWRFQAFTLTIQEVDTHTTPYTYSETYSQVEIIDTAKPKGKANRKATIFFALPII